ncbi:MAG: hypothetical protein IKO20_06240 [Bacteroidaceae bacterium]|nr:hypothetical protein [Bacteroidaceae bacterium]
MKKFFSLLSIALLMSLAFPAQAQILRRLGRAVRQQAEQVVSSVTGNEQQTTTNEGQTTANEGQTVGNEGQVTSSETTDVPEGLFPYDKTAFANTGVYLDGTQKIEDYVYYLYVKICEAITYREGAHKVYINACCTGIPGGKVLAYGEPVVNAFFYEYMQKPDDYKNFRQMIKAYVVAYHYAFGYLAQKMVDGSQNQIIDSDGNTQTLWEDEPTRCARGFQLMRAAEELAMKSDYQNIFESVYSIYTQAEKAYSEGNKVAAYNNYRELECAWTNFLTKHPKWASDQRADQFTQMYQAAMKKRNEIRLEVIDENKVAQDMPQTYAAIPGVEAKVRMCIGREDPEHKNAPVVFLSSGWRPLYRSGSNIIDQRAVDVGWTYTDSKGQKWLAYTTLMQKAVYRGLTVQYIDSYMFSGGFKTMKLK